MNTNSNVYTVIYTTVVVVVVAAVLAFAAMQFKPKQIANVKAETLSQMMAAAQLGEKAELSALGNDAVLSKYSESIDEAFTINLKGEKVRDLSTELSNIELIDNLKPQHKNIISGSDKTELPVYVFKSGVTVVPVYGAGLWGPIWGYVAFQTDGKTIAGAYFDHASETPGLGAKIKDDITFRQEFVGKKALFQTEKIFNLAKNATKEGSDNAVDAISGATMTSQGLNEAINIWLKAYETYFTTSSSTECETVCSEGESCKTETAEEE